MEGILAMPMSKLQQRRRLVKRIRRAKRSIRQLVAMKTETPSEVLTPEGIARIGKLYALSAELHKAELDLAFLDMVIFLRRVKEEYPHLSLQGEANKGVTKIRSNL
jgi:hypothetical protein